MYKKIIILIILCTIKFANAQVGIGTSNPNSSAALDIVSTSKGVLVPSFNLIALTDPTTPVLNPKNGLLIYNNVSTTNTKNFYYWYQDSWHRSLIYAANDTMVLSSSVTASPSSPLSTDNGKNNKITSLQLLENTVGSYNAATGDITLPAGKYKVEFAVDASLGTGTAVGPRQIGTIAQQTYYFSFRTYLKDSDNVILSESIDNEVITNTFATFSTFFFIDLPTTTTFGLYVDGTSDNLNQYKLVARTNIICNIFKFNDL